MILVRVRYSLFLLAPLRQITVHRYIIKVNAFWNRIKYVLCALTYYKRINLITRRIVLVVGAILVSGIKMCICQNSCRCEDITVLNLSVRLGKAMVALSSPFQQQNSKVFIVCREKILK